MGLTDEDRQRRITAKRNNERVKLAANLFNAISIAVIGAAVVLPAISTPDVLLTVRPWILILIAFGLHSVAHAILGLMRSED